VILRLLHPGSAGRGPLSRAADEYKKRLSRHYRVEEDFLKATVKKPTPVALAEEAERIRGAVRPRQRLVALAVDGEPWSSERLAERLAAWMNAGHTGVCFALGSAEGLDPTLTREADERWSFGPLTLPHDLARVVLWEQLYRAGTILRGEPYHK